MTKIMTYAKIKKWLDQHEIKNYTIRLDGVVDVDGNVWIPAIIETELPIQFGTVSGEFFLAYSNNKINSLKGIPQVCGSRFSCCRSAVTSLSGIDKAIKHIGGQIFCNQGTTHLLGLLLIKGVTRICVENGGGTIDKIMNKYIGTGNVIMAQDELIDAGFIEQAKL